jgi:drug/metabolite transporter (DMT)-like permease
MSGLGSLFVAEVRHPSTLPTFSWSFRRLAGCYDRLSPEASATKRLPRPWSAPRPGSTAGAYLGALFAVLVWGASFIATKIAVRESSPLTVICLRFGIGVLVLFAAVARRGGFYVPPARDLLTFAAIGVLGITIHQGLQVTGLVTAQASTTAWIITATPLTMALVGWVVLKERVRWRQAGGIAVGAAGVLLVVSRGDWRALASGTFGSIGDFLVSLSTFTWALFSVYSRQALQRHAAATMMLYVMVGGWLAAALPWAATGGFSDIARLSVSGWSSLVFLGVFCSGLAYVYWYDALRVLPAARVGILLYLEPLVTMAVAAAVLGEIVTMAAILGGFVILLGVRIATVR